MGYFFSDTRVQCLSLRVDLHYLKQAARCQDSYKNKALVIFCDTFNDEMYFAISQRGSQSAGIYGIPAWFQRRLSVYGCSWHRYKFIIWFTISLKSVQNAFERGRREAAQRHMRVWGSRRTINSRRPQWAGPEQESTDFTNQEFSSFVHNSKTHSWSLRISSCVFGFSFLCLFWPTRIFNILQETSNVQDTGLHILQGWIWRSAQVRLFLLNGKKFHTILMANNAVLIMKSKQCWMIITLLCTSLQNRADREH